jgi:hypothetical protein
MTDTCNNVQNHIPCWLAEIEVFFKGSQYHKNSENPCYRFHDRKHYLCSYIETGKEYTGCLEMFRFHHVMTARDNKHFSKF